METTDWAAVQRIVPELMGVLQNRLRILQRVNALAPIGRRALAQAMGQSERTLRSELDALKQQGLLLTSTSGVTLSTEGLTLLRQLEPVAAALAGRSDLAWRLSQALAVANVIVVEGDSDVEPWVTERIGSSAGELLIDAIRDGDVIAVTGGTTVAALAKSAPVRSGLRDIQVVPARGTVGETVAYQANTIAAELAEKLGGRSVMLHIPDSLSQKALEQLLEDPYIQQRLPVIRSATVVVHGIGDALAMARRRHASDAELALLTERAAKAEAFGHYFNAYGEVVYAMQTIGLRLTDVDRSRLVVAVAGGASKAQAIAAVAQAYRIDVLVTDEGAARRLLQMKSELDM
ncbi:transcriptional regulator, DeoR family [Alicyclobacillus hesperidum URH17-3-68]|uniref:Central glycolytic genes regulator n=1 Tax=Alicyclobacillus hesperidum TaxID=89784 RepID=A0A1H2QG23_9BACL|nr:sugar-binding domain-containing protein [Alicyclobacillus hesperidum]EJY54714.1 transcriptional regulator, DeoR family [Alicyclobacillus hesperidum URH17-3-68]SDW05584.1 central glycolytic genes regulator [Alicyclobacillus hesperidum]